MAKFVRVKNKLHGGVASLPEAALHSFPAWEPVDGPKPSRPKPKRNPESVAASPASTEQE